MQNLHTHTTYCDGALSVEEMIKAAIAKGCDSIGFSEHSFVAFDEIYSMTPEMTPMYVNEVNALKDKYKDMIEVFLGLERDYFTSYPAFSGNKSLRGGTEPHSMAGPADCAPLEFAEEYDFIIGSVHHVRKGDSYVTVDVGAKNQKKMADTYFGGDYYAMSEAYFETIADVVCKTSADIIGHFDLVAKYNFGGRLFDEAHPRYINAALGAMDEILKRHKLFEVNTGAMYRFNKPEPYPSAFLLKELCKRGGEVILSSDSHDAESICYKFNEMLELLKACGFRSVKRLTKEGFIDVGIH